MKTNPPRPRISVILTAFGRPDYVRDSIGSLAGQSANHQAIEVVIVSDLSELASESLIRRLGLPEEIRVRLINPGPMPIGFSHLSAITHSSGEIITFLNDDDVWEAERVAVVLDAFESNPNLGYFHNNQSLISSDGSSTSRIRYALLRHPSILFANSDLLVSIASSEKDLVRIRRYEPDFNSSSIAFRRGVLNPWISHLTELDVMDDGFYFYCALASGQSIFLSSRRLTKYRIHSRNRSYHSKAAQGIPAERGYALTLHYLAEHRRLRSLFARVQNPCLVRAMTNDRRYLALVHEIQSARPNRRECGRLLLEALAEAPIGPTWKDVAVNFAMMAKIVSPRLTRALYSRA